MSIGPATRPDRGDAASVHRLWLQLVARQARCRALEARLVQMEQSRSWRITAPLRALAGHFRKPIAGQTPPHRAEVDMPRSAVLAGWQDVFEQATRDAGLPSGLGGSATAPRCLVDVTELAAEDLGAGVQRLTRRWLTELLVDPGAYAVEPVRLGGRGRYVLARQFLSELLGLAPGAMGADVELESAPGDFLLGLDFCRDRSVQLEPALQRLRSAGTPVALVLPDMLPLQHPDWFPPHIAPAFGAWLEVCVRNADTVVCISRDSARALGEWLGERPAPRVVVVQMGADLPPAPPVALPVRQAGAVRLLMVGTIEPRKRYGQALDALDLLELRGVPVDLMIVGRRGWESDALFARIARHVRRGHLHWLDDADDATLAAAYRRSDLLVMASSGEGYGLPVGEAALLGCGLLLRDIPVFREVAGASASYFSGTDGAALADAITGWIEASGTRPDPRAGDWVSWQQSAISLKNETIQWVGGGAHGHNPPAPVVGSALIPPAET